MLRLLIALSVTIFLLGLYFWNPNAHPLTVCRFHQFTGVSCPTCGMSRSLQAAAHFHFADSIKFHGAGWIVVLGLILVFIWNTFAGVSGKKPAISFSPRQKKWVFGGLIVIWIIAWMINIVRDLN
ncbi:MAG: DUF2752 domain-containing protein [Calditrichaeota bacterium]|nr:DUF2752 domain-containing protein [Calditrichota bacterium]